MTSQYYSYLMLISNLVGIASFEEYICTDPTGGDGPFSPPDEIVNMTHLYIIHRRIDILSIYSFACYELREVCYQIMLLCFHNIYRRSVYQKQLHTKRYVCD